MLTVVFDAGPLITACKFEAQGKLVIDHMLSGCRIVVTPSVEEEVAVLGAGYPDGVVAGERIVQGGIQVAAVAERKWARHLADYALGEGERDSIELCRQVKEVEALVTDDYIAFAVRSRYRVGVIEHSLARLQEVKRDVEGRGTDQGRDSAGCGAS